MSILASEELQCTVYWYHKVIFRSTFIALIKTNTKGQHISFTLILSAKDANQNKFVLTLSKHFFAFVFPYFILGCAERGAEIRERFRSRRKLSLLKCV